MEVGFWFFNEEQRTLVLVGRFEMFKHDGHVEKIVISKSVCLQFADGSSVHLHPQGAENLSELNFGGSDCGSRVVGAGKLSRGGLQRLLGVADQWAAPRDPY